MKRFEREYWVASWTSGVLDIREKVKDSPSGRKWIAEHGEDGNEYAVIAFCMPIYTVTVKTHETRELTAAAEDPEEVV